MGVAIQLTEGYGVAFNECEHIVTDDDIIIKFPQKLKPGKLLLVEAGDDGMMIPFILFDGAENAVICFGFYARTDKGFLKLDLSSLPHTLSEIIASGGVTAKYSEPDIDMSEYEKKDSDADNLE
jgi:hypothetical protein